MKSKIYEIHLSNNKVIYNKSLKDIVNKINDFYKDNDMYIPLNLNKIKNIIGGVVQRPKFIVNIVRHTPIEFFKKELNEKYEDWDKKNYRTINLYVNTLYKSFIINNQLTD
jgi:hypothetical protein